MCFSIKHMGGFRGRPSEPRPPLSEFSGTAPETASESDFSYLELSGVNSCRGFYRVKQLPL